MEFEFERLLSRVKPLKDTEIQIHFPLFKSKPHLFLSANSNQLQRWRGCSIPQAKRRSCNPAGPVEEFSGSDKDQPDILGQDILGHRCRGLLPRFVAGKIMKINGDWLRLAVVHIPQIQHLVAHFSSRGYRVSRWPMRILVLHLSRGRREARLKECWKP